MQSETTRTARANVRPRIAVVRHMSRVRRFIQRSIAKRRAEESEGVGGRQWLPSPTPLLRSPLRRSPLW